MNQDETDNPGGLLLGTRLRRARTEANISLRALARRVGVSPSFMSQVERDLASPSVGTLYNIVSELGLSLDTLMHDGRSSGKSTAQTAEKAASTDLDEAPDGLRPTGNVAHLPDVGQLPGLQRADERPEIFIGGVRWERLTPSDDPDIEFLRVTYVAGSESCSPDNLSSHGGREYFHILSGRLDVQVAFARQTLSPGDSINFDSSTPHRLSNPYTEECIAIWFVVGRQ
ncbi:helix-turn-helix domain-containing protein [Arthrobacter sp. cf158]|uniref:helix-turn-helix domain-containing protein n=1 Tax=Arthrobacter sp. cf158 TaxID=1761744 RepID=UPI001C31DC3F|nr:XRE family transcriptional regulator [Arthrobacter sp. cf158]